MLIFRSKFVRGVDGTGPLFSARPGLVVSSSPLPALLRRYDTDAHCAQYELIGAKPNRVRKAALGALRERGADVVLSTLLVDVDGPDHGKDAVVLSEWRKGQLAALEALPFETARYDTRGGYRLVFRYPVPVSPEDHEGLYYPAIVDLLEGYGIEADHACKDWTRLFRLPFVTRDGSEEDHPHTLDRGLPVLPVERLDIAAYEAKRKAEKEQKARRRRAGQSLVEGTAGNLEGVRGLPELFSARKLIRAHHASRIDVVCPWEHSHSGQGSPSATSLLRLSGGGWAFKCHHNHSGLPFGEQGAKGTGDVRRLWRDEWDQYCAEPTPQADEERAERTALADIRAGLPGVIRRAIAAGRAVVAAPTGSGKTKAALEVVIEEAKSGRVVLFAAPTRDVRDEIAERVKALSYDVDVYTLKGREPSNCDAWDYVAPLFRPGGPKAVKAFCDNCLFRDRCAFYGQFNRARYRDAGRIVVTTHDLVFRSASVLDNVIDILVVDEDPTSTIAGELTATAEHIDQALAEGAVSMSDETRGALGRIMGGQSATSTDLREIEGAITLEDPDALAVGAVAADAADLPGRAPYQLGEALAMAQGDDWRGASVLGGALLVPTPRLQWPEAKARIVLDASASPTLAEYILPGSTFIDAGTPAEVDHVEVIRYPVAGGRRDILRRPEYAYSIHRHYDSPSTLHVTHKGLVDDAGSLGRYDWISDAIGPVDYFGSPRQSATNQYSEIRCIVLDSWHLPKAVIRNLAERIEGGQPGLEERESFEAARGALEWRAVDQWIGRLRSVNRTEPLKVVLVDRRPHWSNVLPDHETIGALGARVFEQTGALINRAGGVEAYLGQRLAREGAVWLDDPGELATITPDGKRPTMRQAKPLHCLRSQYRGRFAALGEVLGRLVGRTVRVGSVGMIKGNRSWRRWFAYIEGASVYGELIERAALIEGVDWIDYEDGRHAGPSNRYHTAAELAETKAKGAPLTVAGVAEWAGRSERQVLRMLQKLGRSTADLASDGAAVFACKTPPDAKRARDSEGFRAAMPVYRYSAADGFERRQLARGPPASR